VWAHAEYVKLKRSLRDGRVFDMPPQTVARYRDGKTRSEFSAWRYNHKIRTMKSGRTLRIEVLQPALVHWSADFWSTVQDTQTRDTGFGISVADLATKNISPGGTVLFTLYWPEQSRWEGVDFSVSIA
ncbi:MAG TPA: glucan 1,4-alpha-glucosidase, partial [Nitrospirota bacterium]|nr:glucan 1,4-alpha-glucosidase [Nitrospirota bacterium]